VKSSCPAPSFPHNIPFVLDPGFRQSHMNCKVNVSTPSQKFWNNLSWLRTPKIRTFQPWMQCLLPNFADDAQCNVRH